MFVSERAVYVVTSSSVTRFDHDGSLLFRVVAEREITTAAFADDRLVVADKAILTTYDEKLMPISSGTLLESCASGALISGRRFVCGPGNDWDRVFYTYDIETSQLLANSEKYTYNGLPMRRVPGTDDFVTVTVDSVPSDFHLYSVIESGEPVFINESPYHGDFRVTNVYAFSGWPTSHLVTDTGLLLRIYGEGCNAQNEDGSGQCFEKDGDLGTLVGSQVFVGMESDEKGKLYGLVEPNAASFSSSRCEDGCLLQRIDVSSRSIEQQELVRMDLGRVVALRHDATSERLILGYRLSGDYFYGDSYPGFRVVAYETRR